VIREAAPGGGTVPVVGCRAASGPWGKAPANCRAPEKNRTALDSLRLNSAIAEWFRGVSGEECQDMAAVAPEPDGGKPEDESRKLKVEYLYKEYTRIHDTATDYAKSSFDDFKLLGVIGFIVGWKPLSSWLNLGPHALLVGFSAILLASAVIAARDFLKQSLIACCLEETKYYEAELIKEIGPSGDGIFNGYEHWTTWFKERHRHVANNFYFLFTCCIVVVPAIILYSNESIDSNGQRDVMEYIGLSIFISMCQFVTLRRIYKDWISSEKPGSNQQKTY
jgi:hypothetical protein